jgi:exonuclease VII large subunit
MKIEEKFERILVIFNDARNGMRKNLTRMTENLYFNQKLLSDKKYTILNAFRRSVTNAYRSIHRPVLYKADFEKSLSQKSVYLTSFLTSLRYDRLLNQTELVMAHYEQIVKISDPMRMLRQGYSIMKKDGIVVKNIKNVTIGDIVEVLVSDGSLTTSIQTTKPTKHE